MAPQLAGLQIVSSSSANLPYPDYGRFDRYTPKVGLYAVGPAS